MARAIVLWLMVITCAVSVSGWAAVGEWSQTVLYGGDIPGVAVNSEDPSIIYAITYGEFWAGTAEFYRSTDCGESWVSRSEGLYPGESFYFNCMAVDPVDPTTIFVGGMRRPWGIGYVYKTTNEGEDWVETELSDYIYGIVIDPTNNQNGYMATDGGAYRSTDGGDNWELTPLTLICQSIAIEPDGEAVWVGTRAEGIYRSTDGGASWDFEGLDGRKVWCVLTNPSGSVYAGTDEGLFLRDQSIWENVLPIETRALAGGEESIIYVGTDGEGMYKGLESSWTQCNLGLTNSTIKALGMDPQDHQNVYAGSSFNGVYHTTDGGEWWDWCSEGLRPASVRGIVPHPITPGVVGTATEWGLYWSVDGGETWEPRGWGLGAGTSGLSFDPINPEVAYIHCGGVYKTTDGGDSWELRNNGLEGMGTRSGVCIDPQDPQTLYVGGTRYGSYGAYCTVYKSTDGGDYWFRQDSGLPWGSELAHVGLLAINPHNTSVLYAGTWIVNGQSWGVLCKSENAGASWSGTSLDEVVSAIRVDPYLTDLVHARGSAFWRSTDEGGTWAEVPWNLPGDPGGLGVDRSSFDRLFTTHWTEDTTRIYWSIIDGTWWRLGPPLSFFPGTASAARSIGIDPLGPNVYAGARTSGIFSYTKPYSVTLVPDEALPVQVPAGGALGLTLAMSNLTDEGREVLLVGVGYNAEGSEVLRIDRTLFLPAETTLQQHGYLPIPVAAPPSPYILRIGLTDIGMTEVYDAAGIGFTVVESDE
ncbi:hypothetical protein AMJ39_08330 [candidate division TA06 bacterium DG_24]|uniref:Photosynthesis system II assembly factor Ycf48/Hcf136-like domain-containing protein n=2 Tax=Bacteria division TA06 TaxID=1156500 RepID=A0A0S7WQ44_UNCT6|nr:MAG: hypothetical protein AMJ39_08330 [candidate division TA06 bacterium DG_24]